MQRFQKMSKKVLDKLSQNKVAAVAAGSIISGVNAFASGTPTDFASALPTSLIPTGFWSLVFLVFGLAVTIGGVLIGLKLLKRARG